MNVNLEQYRVVPKSDFKLKERAPDHLDPGIERDAAEEAVRDNRKQLASLQERLYAEGDRALLLVLQAMDTGGKDSTIRSVMEGVNPQGCRIYGFKAPTRHELDRDYLWRVHNRVPPKGHIGIFNRSHYEDVLIVRVHGWASPKLIEQRYRQINEFEQLLSQTGTRIVKVMLNISKEYQLERLRRRLRKPDKHWKFNPADLEERKLWDSYMESYELALSHCSTEASPWYVIPAENRWYRNLLVSQLLVDTLSDMDPQYPEPDFNPADFPPESLS